MTYTLNIDLPTDVPSEALGKWVARNFDTLQLVAIGDDIDDAKRKADAAGVDNVLFEYIEPTGIDPNQRRSGFSFGCSMWTEAAKEPPKGEEKKP